jgi:hypothetical protein
VSSTTTKPAGFTAPGMTAAGTLRHNTTRLLGALNGLMPRLEEDTAKRIALTSEERMRLHGISHSYKVVLERMAAVEASLKATA